jgi:hypothetical protein
MRVGMVLHIIVALGLMLFPSLFAQEAFSGGKHDSLKTQSAVADSATGDIKLVKPILPTYSTLFSYNTTPFLHTSFKDLIEMSGREQRQRMVIHFQHSTAYQFAYADYIRNIDTPKPEYGSGGGFVPIMPIIVSLYYGGKMGYQALKPAPKLNFDEIDWQIWKLIRDKPGLSSTEYYKLYFEKNLQPPITHFLLKQRLDKLENQDLIEMKQSGIENHRRRYFPRTTVDEIIRKIDEELQSLDGNTNARKQALETMRRIILTDQ